MFQERGSLSTNTGVAADLLLEGLEVGAGWGDPVGAEGLVDEVELAAAHVRGREGEAGHPPEPRSSASGAPREVPRGRLREGEPGMVASRGTEVRRRVPSRRRVPAHRLLTTGQVNSAFVG